MTPVTNNTAAMPKFLGGSGIAPIGPAAPAAYPAYQAPATDPTYPADQYRPVTGHPGMTAQNVSAQSANPGFWGWLAGAAAGGLWAIPKLRAFGPVGFLLGLVVVLAGGFYGNRALGAIQELFNGQPRGVTQVAAWVGGAVLTAGVVSTLSVGPAMAALLIWSGSWLGGKVLDLIWP